MARRAKLSGVQAKGPNRIQFDFSFFGVRYRPTLERIPNEANLRRAHEHLKEIKARIKRGTFVFDDEFPDYRFKATMPIHQAIREKTCGDVFDSFLSHCDMRVSMDDMAFSTLHGYRNILDAIGGQWSAAFRSRRLPTRSWPASPRIIRRTRRPTTTS
jgi:hypothetical protein